MVHKRADDTTMYVRSVIRALSAACAAMVILAGCTPPPAVVNRAVTNIDFAWKQQNDKTLEEIGSRRVKTTIAGSLAVQRGADTRRSSRLRAPCEG